MLVAISIHAPRAGGDGERLPLPLPVKGISIHAPRAGGDGVSVLLMVVLSDFNPRPPCGGRPDMIRWTCQAEIFQSTPPVRGATEGAEKKQKKKNYFNPRPPCGGRRAAAYIQEVDSHFNPRPPCGGRLLKFESLFGFSNNSCMVIRFLAVPSSLL